MKALFPFARWRKLSRILVAPLLLISLTGARYWVTSLSRILEPDHTVQLRERIIVHPGDTILKNRVAKDLQVELLDDVTVVTPGLTESFKAKDRLTEVAIATNAGFGKLVAHLPTSTLYYCHTPQPVTSGAFLQPRGIFHTGMCFYDTDGDKVLDGAFWGDATKSSDQGMVAINNVKVSSPYVKSNEYERYIEVVCSGLKDGKLKFDLKFGSDSNMRVPQSLFLGGRAVSVSSEIPSSQLPCILEIGGAHIELDASLDDAAEIRIDQPIPPGRLVDLNP